MQATGFEFELHVDVLCPRYLVCWFCFTPSRFCLKVMLVGFDLLPTKPINQSVYCYMAARRPDCTIRQ